MNSHKLNIENHFHIIGRQDGVTGDTIKANDEIVFCSACQSVFLKDSWEYMKNEHCQQSETLDFVPSPVPQLIIRKGDKSNDKLIYEVKNEFWYEISRISNSISKLKPQFYSILFSFGLVALMWYTVPERDKNSDTTIVLAFLSLVILFFGNMVGKMARVVIEDRKPNKKTKEYSVLKILETGIIVNEKFYYYNQIETIASNKKENTHKLVVKLKDRRKIIKALPVRNYERTKPFYIALAWAAQFVEIHFQAEDTREQGLLRSVVKNYAGNLFLVEHLSALNSEN